MNWYPVVCFDKANAEFPVDFVEVGRTDLTLQLSGFGEAGCFGTARKRVVSLQVTMKPKGFRSFGKRGFIILRDD